MRDPSPWAILSLAFVVAVSFVVAAVALYLLAGYALGRIRGWCPGCRGKGLKCIHFFRCNPPPNRSYFACEICGAHFVQIHRHHGREDSLIPRVGSPWEHASGWDGPNLARQSNSDHA